MVKNAEETIFHCYLNDVSYILSNNNCTDDLLVHRAVHTNLPDYGIAVLPRCMDIFWNTDFSMGCERIMLWFILQRCLALWRPLGHKNGCILLAVGSKFWLLGKSENISITNSRKIVDLRNRIIQGYDSVSDDMVWGIVVRHIPILKSEIETLLQE